MIFKLLKFSGPTCFHPVMSLHVVPE